MFLNLLERLLKRFLGLLALVDVAAIDISLDMNGLAVEVLKEIRMTEPERQFVTEIRDLPDAQGDPAMIRQVFANLLSNGVKFTRGREGARIEVGSFQDSGEQSYYVKDNGVGFDMKYYSKLRQRRGVRRREAAFHRSFEEGDGSIQHAGEDRNLRRYFRHPVCDGKGYDPSSIVAGEVHEPLTPVSSPR
jgi:light-regulated signal transduction histidine kinase (bacteriophytochrome)